MHGGDIYSQKVKYDFSVNINPLGIPPLVKKIWKQTLKVCEQYPDTECHKLKELLSRKFSISSESIIFGNGASELISEIIQIISPEKAILIAPAFTGYKKALSYCKTKIIFFENPNLENENCFSMTQEKLSLFIKKIEDEKPELVILCNPNNPDGNLIEKNYLLQIAEVCRRNNIFVLLDESFIELTEKENCCSMKNEISLYKNLFVLRAFTKTYAVPGIRLGYGFCSDEKIISLLKEKLPEWNVSSVAQKIGLTCLEEKKYLETSGDAIKAERNYLTSELKKMGLKVYNSQVNFILFYSDCNLQQELLKKEILIRDCSDYEGLEKGFYRIAVKCHKENKILVKEIRKLLENCYGKN